MNTIKLTILALISTALISSAQTKRKIIRLDSLTDNFKVINLIPFNTTSNTFKVSQERRTYIKDSISIEFLFSYILNQKVLDRKQNSSIIEWTFNQNAFIYQIFTHPTIDSAKKQNETIKVIFEMSSEGELLSILNCEDFRKQIVNIYQLNDKIVDELNPEDRKFALSYGSSYQELYNNDRACSDSKKLLKMIIFDVFSFFQGLSYSTTELTHHKIIDTSSIINHYWRNDNQWVELSTLKIKENQYKITDNYFDKTPDFFTNQVSGKLNSNKISKNNLEARANKAYLDTIRNLKLRLKKQNVSKSTVDSIIKTYEKFLGYPYVKRRFTLYKKFNPKERFIVINDNDGGFEKIYTEINSDYSDIELKYLIKLQQRIFVIEKLN